jgi:hypothetical protein
MYPGGVALKADGLGGFGRVEWPLVTAEDSQQGLAALTGQRTMDDGLPAPGWHSAIITHESEENKVRSKYPCLTWSCVRSSLQYYFLS